MKQNPNSPANYGKAMDSAYKNTKVFPSVKPKKMTPMQIQKRRRSVISNAAQKVMNKNYSK